MTHCWRAAPFGTARCVRASKSAAERRKAEGCIRMSPPVTLLHLGVHKRADQSLISLLAKIIFLHAIKYILHYRIFSYFYVIFIGKFLFLRFSLPTLLLSESQSSGRVSRVLNWPCTCNSTKLRPHPKTRHGQAMHYVYEAKAMHIIYLRWQQ